MRQPHRWEELLPEEFNEEMARASIVYLACGAMEDHGLHNALGSDPYTAYETCLRAAEISGGIVFPPIPFAPAGIPGYSREELRSGTRDLYPPSLWVSGELCERIYVEVLESLADMGVRVCMANGGHWPADLLLQRIEKEHEGHIGSMRFWGGGTVRLLEDANRQLAQEDPLALGHGTMWETSLLMAFRPDWVDVARAARIAQSPIPSQLKRTSPEKIAHISAANPALGNRMINLAAQRLAAKARELLAS
ncbi:MAG: creatininase family protein [Armatimonadetes bacterium]|nr:creatininase family protein [Armatimonadota bacterium]